MIKKKSKKIEKVMRCEVKYEVTYNLGSRVSVQYCWPALH